MSVSERNHPPSMKTFITLYLLALLIPFIAAGQEQSDADSLPLRLVRTRDGNEFIGTVVQETKDTLTLQTTAYGLVSFPTSQIRRSRVVSPNAARRGVYWFDSPMDTRYFIGTNAFGLRKGEGYYQNVWVSVNQVDVGINDYFSIGAGTIPAFIFGGALPIWTTPKVSIPIVKDRLHIAGGGFFGSMISSWSFGRSSFGYLYGQATWGKRDANITFGGGYIYSEGAWSSKPVFSLSGMARLGKKVALISENYFAGTQDDPLQLISGGLRIIGKNISFDAALAIPVFDYGLAGVPWLSIAAPLGGEYGGRKKRGARTK